MSEPARGMSDRWIYALAGAAVLGALVAWPGPRLVALGLLVGALAVRRPLLVCAAAALLASFGAAAATAAVSAAVEEGPLAGRIVLVDDPSRRHGATRFVADTERGRLEVSAWGSAGARLSGRQAGEGVEVVGRVAAPASPAEWRRHNGVLGRLTVTEVGGTHAAAVHYRIANGLRSVLARGAASLPADQRALFSGLVLGDDRRNSPVTADDFRGAGLTHLLAVSGQNVAFVLLVVQPLVVRLGLWGRWLAILGVLGLFATVTRFEPSVLRATVMAALAVSVWLAGRQASGRRLLALAVVVLVLWQPLLVHSLAFRLSVAASAGILFWASRLAGRIGGPRPVARALAVTVAAQLAVAPLIVPVFGGVPAAAVPANLLAAPAAAGVMMWGLTGGVAAGLLDGAAAGVLHLPTRGLLAWIEAVAAGFTELRLGYLGLAHTALLGLALAAACLARRRTAAVLVAWLAAGAVLLGPLLAARDSPGPFPQALAVGWESTLWWTPEGAVLLLGASESAERLLGDIRMAGAERIDLIVAAAGGARAAGDVAALHRRHGRSVVWAPAGNRIAGAAVPTAGTTVTVGGLVASVERGGPRLEVRVTAAPGGR
ncbi:MAG: ComEC/Rec2 family competence protein [bacterium]|nr:ComEC/Rec2 family competence protein [bacterium]